MSINRHSNQSITSLLYHWYIDTEQTFHHLTLTWLTPPRRTSLTLFIERLILLRIDVHVLLTLWSCSSILSSFFTWWSCICGGCSPSFELTAVVCQTCTVVLKFLPPTWNCSVYPLIASRTLISPTLCFICFCFASVFEHCEVLQ